MDSELDLSEFCCLNKDCPDYGKKGKGNVRVKERYGSKNRALLRCNTCTHCFSETKGTIFFGLKTPDEEVLRTLAMIPEKGSIRATARATGYDKDTICRWLDIARAHCQEVTDYYFQELDLGQVQIEEIWSYIKKKVTIQPYKLWLLITKVHFVTFYETFIANVVRYRFHEDKDIVEVGSNGL